MAMLLSRPPGRPRPAKRVGAWTGFAVIALGAWSPAHPVLADQGAAGGLPKASPAIVEIVDGVRYELDRLEADGRTVLVFKAGEAGHPVAGLPLAPQARALDRLLGRQIGARPLPSHVQVRLADTRYALISALQLRMQGPGSGWDPRLGRARSGASGAFIQKVLSEVVDASPLPPVFARHGYRLRLTDVARIEVGRVASSKGAKLPTEINEMDFAADPEG